MKTLTKLAVLTLLTLSFAASANGTRKPPPDTGNGGGTTTGTSGTSIVIKL